MRPLIRAEHKARMVGTHIGDLIVETLNIRVEASLLAAATNLRSHETCVELADTGGIDSALAHPLRIENDLVSSIVACRARMAQIATDYLVACHHDLGTPIWSNRYATAALIIHMSTQLLNRMDLLAVESDRSDKTVTVALVSDL